MANSLTREISSTSNRFSAASTNNGESSNKNSNIFENNSTNPPHEPSAQQTVGASGARQNDRGSFRSHKTRGSGGFLLSSSIFDTPSIEKLDSAPSFGSIARRREPARDPKGKSVRVHEKKHSKTPSLGSGIGGSPLAAVVTHSGQQDIESAGSLGENSTHEAGNDTDKERSPAAMKSNSLDVDSAQIVNLALNLSESRKIVAKRNVSTPLTPTLTPFGEGVAGGSLRQYLQQQRRSSRNVSPKPDRGDRAFTASPRMIQGQRLESPLQAAFGSMEDTENQYHFSFSTLARAEKAKKAIELMAQYRRLLQYVPPLKPQIHSRALTKSPPNTSAGSPTNPGFPLTRTSSATVAPRPLGRPYNPLQYIRNRKVRARERKGIDGEAQGFGDVESVTSWVGAVSKESTGDGYRCSDCVSLPPFVTMEETPKSPHASPQNAAGRSSNTIRRPRVDWVTSPADMLADIFWLEQGDNKKLIEDNRERKLFPQNVDLIRPVLHQDSEPEEKAFSSKENPEEAVTANSELPKSNYVRRNEDHHQDNTRGRALHKLQKATHLPEDFDRLGHEQHLLKSHVRSSSESSNSDSATRLTRHRRSATADTQELERGDIFEKQMMEIMEKEARESQISGSRDRESQRIVHSAVRDKIDQREEPEKTMVRQKDSDSLVSYMSGKGHHILKELSKPSADYDFSSNRASLEDLRHQNRVSLDGLDSTAPNSPESNAASVANRLIPTMDLDLSPPPSRGSSPIRNPALERMKSKINPFHDRSRNHSRSNSVRGNSSAIEDGKTAGRSSLDVPFTPLRRKRSESPVKRVISRKIDDNTKSTISKAGSIRRRVEDVPSGIKGLFKGGRNPVSKVGDLIWRKDASPVSGVSSNTSTDYSDQDDESEGISKNMTFDKASKSNSRDTSGESVPPKETRSYNLPVFTSPFDKSDTNGIIQDTMESAESDYLRKRQRVREERKNSRFQSLKPPRIDLQTASPSSSPDFPPVDRQRSRSSDISESLDQRGSSASVQSADARLNSILGLPGAAFIRLPVTGLSKLDGNRRPSMIGQRQGSIVGREVSAQRGPMTKREIARIRALLLSSGIKANQIVLRAAEVKNLGVGGNYFRGNDIYAEVAVMNRNPQLLKPMPRSQEHNLAATVLTTDVQISSQQWEVSAEKFNSHHVGGLLDRIEQLKDRIRNADGLSELTRAAAEDADRLSNDLVTGQMRKVKSLIDDMQNMMRRRRARFRWVRRGGWVMVEWVLIGFMWGLWSAVMVFKIVRGIFSGAFRAARWLFWLP